jgi:hypothetical protein
MGRMAKRRMCEDRLGRTSAAKVRLVGWGSSLLDEAGLPSHSSVGANALRAWKTEAATPAWNGRGETEVYQGIAQVMACNNRRHQPRLAQSAEIRIQQFSCEMGGVIAAEVKNRSRSGICAVSGVPLFRGSVVQCEIGVPDMTFAVPALMQVVWVEETGPSQYEVGLRYLF